MESQQILSCYSISGILYTSCSCSIPISLECIFTRVILCSGNGKFSLWNECIGEKNSSWFGGIVSFGICWVWHWYLYVHMYIKEHFHFPTHTDLPHWPDKGSILLFLSSKHCFSLIFNTFFISGLPCFCLSSSSDLHYAHLTFQKKWERYWGH